MVATAWSKDPAMERAFTEPEVLTLPDGTTYKNPYADLHTLTAVKCCAPALFHGVTEHEWVSKAKENGSRHNGKTTNFGIIFDQTAESLSLLNHVKLAETEQWVKGHKQTYAGYHHWAEEYGAIAAARGFAVSPVSKAIRWVDEENSKGGGESPARAAVNYAIQGESSMITKECLIRLYETLPPEIKILNTVHDRFCRG
jgi:DNA polymerase I-like protein with 3'-5' exonuclease and polymerase domains